MGIKHGVSCTLQSSMQLYSIFACLMRAAFILQADRVAAGSERHGHFDEALEILHQFISPLQEL